MTNTDITKLNGVGTPDFNAPNLLIQKIYLKDLSCESPHVPEVFKLDQSPQVDLQLNISSTQIEHNLYEVELHIIAKAAADLEANLQEHDKTTVFCIEVRQAGLFTVQGLGPEQLEMALNVTCPTILYPYTGALISDLTTRASFMPLYLAPVNFEHLYQERYKKLKPEQTH